MISSKVRLQLVNCRDSLFWANSALGRKARVVEVLCSAPPVAFAFLLHEIRFPDTVWRAFAVLVKPAAAQAGMTNE